MNTSDVLIIKLSELHAKTIEPHHLVILIMTMKTLKKITKLNAQFLYYGVIEVILEKFGNHLSDVG